MFLQKSRTYAGSSFLNVSFLLSFMTSDEESSGVLTVGWTKKGNAASASEQMIKR